MLYLNIRSSRLATVDEGKSFMRRGPGAAGQLWPVLMNSFVHYPLYSSMIASVCPEVGCGTYLGWIATRFLAATRTHSCRDSANYFATSWNWLGSTAARTCCSGHCGAPVNPLWIHSPARWTNSGLLTCTRTPSSNDTNEDWNTQKHA